MRFEVINTYELDQFIKENNVDTEESNLTSIFEHLRNGTYQMDDNELALNNGFMIFLVCNKEDGNITVKNFVLKLRENK